MKTYNEILKDIENAKKELKKAEETESKLINEITTAESWERKKEIKKSLSDKITKAATKKEDLNITIKMLKNNARVALFHEAMPVVVETLGKYKNKPYGEKTRQKISDEIKEKTGCRCYIGGGYGNTDINIYPEKYGYDITAGTMNTPLLIENRVQPVNVEDIKLYYIRNTYIEDIPAAIAEMRAAYAKAVETQKELEKICDQFNAYAVEGIERIYKDKYIYERFTV